MSEQQGMKIDSGSVYRCKLPPPRVSLIEKMASGGYTKHRDYHGHGDSWAPWERLPEPVQESWRNAARGMYAALALEAGALPEGLPEEGRGNG